MALIKIHTPDQKLSEKKEFERFDTSIETDLAVVIYSGALDSKYNDPLCLIRFCHIQWFVCTRALLPRRRICLPLARRGSSASVYAIDASTPLVASTTPFRVYVWDVNLAEFSLGHSFSCLNEGCGSSTQDFSNPVHVPTHGTYSVVVLCSDFPCGVQWNVGFSQPIDIPAEIMHGDTSRRQLVETNGCIVTDASISTGYTDWILAYACKSATVGQVLGKVESEYFTVKSINNDYFRVMNMDNTNYQLFVNYDSRW
ncbi:Aste57867_1297 [Aphanomyces stellatus]|uniref:Aste57867_1297 protein n=1 Tax=Aphanomyces stellatus TaxID=120398 RepID=A0A485K644_9STRA|nr:hypothetical protein As57867_001296 [Aphanomyces stellatus]VFT78516.1 Aste57867_1297 [Aphanomyces stellatus]